MISKEKIIAVAKECNAQERVYKTSPGLDHFLLETAHLECFANHFYEAGAASRDAEVVSLTNQRDYEYVRAENAEQDRLLIKIAPEDAEIAGLMDDAARYRFLRKFLSSKGVIRMTINQVSGKR